MATLFLRPSQLDVARLTTLLAEVHALRPAAESGGRDWLFSARATPPVVSYMASIAELRTARDDAIGVLATGAPATPGRIAHLATLVGDPDFDRPACRQGPPHGELVVVTGSCVAPAPMLFKIGGIDARTLGQGWSYPEVGGQWIDGARASLRVAVPLRAAAEPAPKLKIATFAFLPYVSPARHATVGVEGGGAESFTFDRSKATSHSFELSIPPAAVKAGVVILSFQAPDALAPRSVGAGPDDRRLGIGLESVTVQ